MKISAVSSFNQYFELPYLFLTGACHKTICMDKPTVQKTPTYLEEFKEKAIPGKTF
ncbi:MAG: hypothetical protein IPH18_12480 [Chitinophagaceae bacterium]|nr:hypothetical protein [Chitinophagaceae bacterium]